MMRESIHMHTLNILEGVHIFTLHQNPHPHNPLKVGSGGVAMHIFTYIFITLLKMGLNMGSGGIHMYIS